MVQKWRQKLDVSPTLLLQDSDSQSCSEKFALHDATFPFVGVLEVRTVCVAAVDGQKEAPSLLL